MAMSNEIVELVDLATPESGGDCFVMIGLAKPARTARAEAAMNDLAKPESGRILFLDAVEASSPPSGACLCTSEQIMWPYGAYTIDSPALRFRGSSLTSLRYDVSSERFRGSLADCICREVSPVRSVPMVTKLRVQTAKLGVAPGRVQTATVAEAVEAARAAETPKPARTARAEAAMNDLAKPESGGLCLMWRVGTLCPPSGACLCTSERINWQCSAYTIDVPALRFRRNSLASLRLGVLSWRFLGSSLASIRHDVSSERFRGNSLASLRLGVLSWRFRGSSLAPIRHDVSSVRFRGSLPHCICREVSPVRSAPMVTKMMMLSAKPDVVPATVLTAKPDVVPVRVLTAKPESGRLCVICCVGTLCPPSGACLCTSERIMWPYGAYTIDVPALRFRRNTRHTFPEGSRHMFRRTSFVACREYSYENSS